MALAAGGAAAVMAGCSNGYAAVGTHTATVLINGVEAHGHLPVRCEQVQWNWYIETLDENPGFAAQFQTGDSLIARGLRIDNVGGFTGSFWEGTVGRADVEITDGTVEMSGVAEGYFAREPAERATAEFLIRTEC